MAKPMRTPMNDKLSRTGAHLRSESSCYKGFFELIDANIVSDGKRNVFKFSLKPVQKKSFGRVVDLPQNRLIPTAVKVEVWTREQALKHMRDYTALPEHEIETEVDRYIAWPWQALSYYMGELASVQNSRTKKAGLFLIPAEF